MKNIHVSLAHRTQARPSKSKINKILAEIQATAHQQISTTGIPQKPSFKKFNNSNALQREFSPPPLSQQPSYSQTSPLSSISLETELYLLRTNGHSSLSSSTSSSIKRNTKTRDKSGKATSTLNSLFLSKSNQLSCEDAPPEKQPKFQQPLGSVRIS